MPRYEESLSKIISAVLASCEPGGVVHDYFLGAGIVDKERTLRTKFSELMQALQTGEPADPQALGLAAFRALRFYKIRTSGTEAAAICRSVCSEIDTRQWSDNGPLRLQEWTDESAVELGEVLPMLLREIAANGTNQFVAVAKFMHFCFPTTFPIHDGQAAASIEAWSYFAFHLIEEETRNKFAFDNLARTDGSGYRDLLDFYRSLLEVAEDLYPGRLAEVSGVLGGRIAVPITQG